MILSQNHFKAIFKCLLTDTIILKNNRQNTFCLKKSIKRIISQQKNDDDHLKKNI